jgi:hypothetical protein
VADLLLRPASAKGVTDPAGGQCAGKFIQVGQPLYPYVLGLITRANGPDSFDRLISHLADNARLRVAAGAPGSGGRVTLERILAARPEWSSKVQVLDESTSTALLGLRDGRIDAVFVMDGIESPFFAQLQNEKDERGRPRFTFADMRPGRTVTGSSGPKDANNRPLYTLFTLAPGWMHSTKVPSTPAVLIVNTEFSRTPEGQRAVQVLHAAVDSAVRDIRAQTKTPADWNPDSNEF